MTLWFYIILYHKNENSPASDCCCFNSKHFSNQIKHFIYYDSLEQKKAPARYWPGPGRGNKKRAPFRTKKKRYSYLFFYIVYIEYRIKRSILFFLINKNYIIYWFLLIIYWLEYWVILSWRYLFRAFTLSKI